ncbi:MAG: sulfatase-like hydrolase/transferase [Peptococcaceae bacterium]|nr:sulfatase-like hydrolase/transferase [Peptococcaceae bacterium]
MKFTKQFDPNLLDQWTHKVRMLLYYVVVFVFLEFALQLIVYGSVSNVIAHLLFACISGCLFFLCSSLLPDKINRIIFIALIVFLVVYYEVQFIYYTIFKSFMPVSQIFLGAAAVVNFAPQILFAIKQNLIGFLVLLLPIPVSVLLLKWKKVFVLRLNRMQIPISMLATGALFAFTMLLMMVTNTSPASAYAVWTNKTVSTETSVKTLGLAATTMHETSSYFVKRDSTPVFYETTLDDLNNEALERNVTDITFTASDTTAKNNKIITDYLATVSATAKNEYTGIAEGYNVVTICAEAFNPLVIDPEMTPTLYKLANSGFVFNNFYNSFRNTTTNGEYAFCMGLLPDFSHNKIESCFNESADNYLPFCLGNALGEQGYETYAYHNYYGSFYDRYITHPNMGYEFKSVGMGLNLPASNPYSDHDMMKESMKDFIRSKKPFHAYYMTYSGHYQYDWTNDMSAKHRDKVAHLPYSEPVQAYIACNLEVEYALQALMKELEAAGKADNTMIVLTADHYPYGLTDEDFNELAGREVDPAFECYRNSFICYVPGMEAVQVDEYCSSIDILPTVLNLLGVDYDSRLLAGKDVLSDAPHLALLYDRSFITKDFRYNANNGEVIPHDPSITIEKDTLQNYLNYVSNIFTLSSAILTNDYYGFIYGVESDSEGIVNYEDIKDPYKESAVVFMVANGYMEPKGETVFGAESKQYVSDCLNTMYLMAGSPAVTEVPEQEAALTWALEEGILDDAALWSEPITIGELSKFMYRQCPDASYEQMDISQLMTNYPELPEEGIRALIWSMDHKIVLGTGEVDSTMTLYNNTIKRATLALYLQRFHAAASYAN